VYVTINRVLQARISVRYTFHLHAAPGGPAIAHGAHVSSPEVAQAKVALLFAHPLQWQRQSTGDILYIACTE